MCRSRAWVLLAGGGLAGAHGVEAGIGMAGVAGADVGVRAAHSERVRAQAARYLEGRIQSRGEQRPGRRPDMGAAAAAAMVDALWEVAAAE